MIYKHDRADYGDAEVAVFLELACYDMAAPPCETEMGVYLLRISIYLDDESVIISAHTCVCPSSSYLQLTDDRLGCWRN